MSSTARSKLGPDEISELAEFLWMCCAESDKPLHVPGPGEFSDHCPFYCAFGPSLGAVPFDDNAVGAFIRGFDGDKSSGPSRSKTSSAMFDLGRRFREQALLYGGFK